MVFIEARAYLIASRSMAGDVASCETSRVYIIYLSDLNAHILPLGRVLLCDVGKRLDIVVSNAAGTLIYYPQHGPNWRNIDAEIGSGVGGSRSRYHDHALYVQAPARGTQDPEAGRGGVRSCLENRSIP